MVGIDGVGKWADGRRVYFFFPREPYRGMAEQTVVDSHRYLDVPDGVDDFTLAALADPGMAAWGARRSRAKFESGETVLINGATGIAGIVAVQIARYLGARHIVATGRNLNTGETFMEPVYRLDTAVDQALNHDTLTDEINSL